MAPNPTVMQAVEKLGYRVTVGDVAAQAGLEISLAQRGLLTLASEARGHLQVAESGEVVYLFPRNFRAVLRSKYFQLQLKEWWEKIWRVLFYLIRISFGILLILSIVLIFVTITILVIAISNREGQRNDRRSGGGFNLFLPYFWFGPDWFWFFDPDYSRSRRRQRTRPTEANQMNFLEAVFSFLFGDGNPNADLEERRWQTIATVIRNNQGAAVAEQVAPYLDDLGSKANQEYEDYMLPVLTRFNGKPEVSPDGQLVYHFPELQTTASQRRSRSIAPYLQEFPWRFSAASSSQILGAIALGAVNLVGALVLGSLLRDGAIAEQIGGLVAFVASIYWLLLGYGIAFLGVPLIRYFWIQWRNQAVEARNQRRQARAEQLRQADTPLLKKLNYAQQFAAETVVSQEDLVYTTEKDLTEQEMERSAQIDAEWERRLRQSGSS